MTNRFGTYEQHGAKLSNPTGDGERHGTCPFCRTRKSSTSKGAGKFYVRADGEVWSCKACSRSGNRQTFMAQITDWHVKNTTPAMLRALSADRGAIEVGTLRQWGIGFDGSQYVYPAWSTRPGGALCVSDARRYTLGGRPMSTTGATAGLMMPTNKGLPALQGTPTLWVCEGEWDGMAWFETLRGMNVQDDVVAVPGASTLPQKMLGIFHKRHVRLLYDNDNAGREGMARAADKIKSAGAASVCVITWPKGTVDGFDIRDLYKQKQREPRAIFDAVQGMVHPYTPKPRTQPGAPGSAGVMPGATAAPSPSDEIDPKGKGMHPRDVLKRYERWLKLAQPEMLDLVFGSVFANRMDVDPLWMFLVGPPGCGKSELLMSLYDAPSVHCSTGISSHSLISGMNMQAGTDPSLLPKLIGKSWIVKDFTTVLGMNQLARDEIFSVLRDAYDGRVEKPYGNGVTRIYEGRFGIVAGVTNKIDSVTAQNAVLGERFIRWRARHTGRVLAGSDVIMRALDNIGGETSMRDDLRDVARRVLNRPLTRAQYPKIPNWFKERVVELAQWCASMRGVVERDRFTGSSNVISSKPQAEIATRLAKQFCTVGMGIGVYQMKTELDEDVYRIVAQVGRDTCPDRAEEILRALYIIGGQGNLKEIAAQSRFPTETVRWVLQDMNLLSIVNQRKGLDGVFTLSKSVETILSNLKLYENDRAWARAHVSEDNE